MYSLLRGALRAPAAALRTSPRALCSRPSISPVAVVVRLTGRGRGIKRPLLGTKGQSSPFSQYRRHGASIIPPTLQPETVVWGIIGGNILVYGVWVWASDSRRRVSWMVDNFTVSAAGLLQEYRLHTLFTAMFSHKDFGHLLMNVVTLYFFGMEAAVILGARRFLSLYFTSGVVSSLW
jgi:membrane associated rhomboid family serine protease